jgi:hypothetical protein
MDGSIIRKGKNSMSHRNGKKIVKLSENTI